MLNKIKCLREKARLAYAINAAHATDTIGASVIAKRLDQFGDAKYKYKPETGTLHSLNELIMQRMRLTQ